MLSALFSRHRVGLFALFVILCALMAAYLRLDFFSDTYYGDEEIPLAVIQHMEQNQSLDTNWILGIWRKGGDRWAYSYNQYNFSSYNSTLYYLNQLFQVSDNNINPAVFNRVCSVVFQVLALVTIAYGTYYLVGIYGAVAASLFFVFNPLLVVDAHYARPESFLIFITALAVFFHLFGRQQKQPRYFFASAFIWGIACACKFSLLPMAGLCALHLLLQPPWQDKKTANAAIWLLCLFAGAFVLAPYMFIHVDKVLTGVQALFKQYLNAEPGSAITFERSDLLLPKYLFGYFGAAFWLAITLALLHRQRDLKCLASFLLAITGFYIVIFSCLSFFNESNLSHLAVAWCLLLAIAVEACILRAREKTNRLKTFFIIITAAIVATPALCAFKIQSEVYHPGATTARQRMIDDFESQLLSTHPGSRIISYVKQPDKMCTVAEIVKIPWAERNELGRLEKEFSDKHYVLLAEIKLPLSELPHSQLQLIHFPASYRYYQLQSTN